MDDHDERIRQRAHEIWEEEGRPEGREYSHWLRARADIREEEGEVEERASTFDIALSTLPPGTVPENPTAENPDHIAQAKPAQAEKPIDARDIDAQLDQPY